MFFNLIRIEGEFRQFGIQDETNTNEDKFQKDLFTICYLLLKVQNEILNNGRFSTFSTRVEGMEQTAMEEKKFMAQFTVNMEYEDELKGTIECERKASKEKLIQISEKVRQTEYNLILGKGDKKKEMFKKFLNNF